MVSLYDTVNHHYSNLHLCSTSQFSKHFYIHYLIRSHNKLGKIRLPKECFFLLGKSLPLSMHLQEGMQEECWGRKEIPSQGKSAESRGAGQIITLRLGVTSLKSI